MTIKTLYAQKVTHASKMCIQFFYCFYINAIITKLQVILVKSEKVIVGLSKRQVDDDCCCTQEVQALRFTIIPIISQGSCCTM